MKITSALTASLAAAVTMVSAFDENTGKYGDIDTNRAPRLFNPPKSRKGGYTYADEMIIDLTAEMDSMGMALKGNFDAKGDMEMVVTSESGGNIKATVGIKNVEASLVSPIMTFKCDSNDRSHSDETCAPVFDVVGQQETLLIDKDGNILELTTPDGETVNLAAMEQMTLGDQFKQNQLAASHHYDKTQQFLKLIPDHAVRPGDTWIEDMDLDRIGNFKGESTLKGYTNYQGSDCAVFWLEGNLHLDVELLAQAMGMDPSELPVSTADAHITNEIIWDVNDQIARWLTVNITTAFDIANPMNPEDDQTVKIPADLFFAVATDITARPDHEEEPASAGVSDPTAYRAPEDKEKSGDVDSGITYEYAEESQSSSSSGGGGGAFKGIFFAILVGMAAAGGFMLYKKRQESWEFVRPSYEFSPVGAEPIYNSPPMV